jgi:hypothetical protein
MKAGIFIVSCDKTRDVLLHFIKGFNIYWSDNVLPVFLGTNDHPLPADFEKATLLSVPKSNWKQETLDQICLLQKKDSSLTHVIVMLDDFILNRIVDNQRILNLINSNEINNIKYLRLKRLEEGIYRIILQFIFTPKQKISEKVFKIRKSHPYFSSLQIAIWDIAYFKSCVSKSENIWQFELQKSLDFDHFSVCNNVFHYRHIVEKGKWESYSSKYCKKYISFFNEGSREFHSNSYIFRIKKFLIRLKFYFLGYLFSNHS